MIPARNIYLLRLLLLTVGLPALAQDKMEVERAASTSEVPTAAREWFEEAYATPTRVQWYFEQTSGETSYEAKLKHAGQWHSVEFGEDGTLQDIEIIVQDRELPKEVRQPIRTYLDTTYTRHRIKKIQRQLTGSPDALRGAVRDEQVSGVTERYEIEFYGKNDQEKALWEGLFDDTGQLLERRRIVLRPTDNLTY